jgi:hypothetical protein
MKDKKDLNIIKAIQKPIGTIFEVYDKYGNKDNRMAKIIEEPSHETRKILVWDNRAYIKIGITNYIADATFVQIPQSVSFMEALASDKKCNVKSEIISKVYNKCSNSSYVQVDIIKNILDGKFDYINSILYALSGYMGSSDWEELIKNGEFYLENEVDE